MVGGGIPYTNRVLSYHANSAASPSKGYPGKKMNLLNVRWIRRLLISRWFPISAQLIMLIAFGLLIAGGFRVSTSDARFAKELRNTNLANLLVWSYWFPLLIVAAVLLGRVWCMVCPMELVSALAVRVGLRRKVPHFFKSGMGDYHLLRAHPDRGGAHFGCASSASPDGALHAHAAGCSFADKFNI